MQVNIYTFKTHQMDQGEYLVKHLRKEFPSCTLTLHGNYILYKIQQESKEDMLRLAIKFYWLGQEP